MIKKDIILILLLLLTMDFCYSQDFRGILLDRFTLKPIEDGVLSTTDFSTKASIGTGLSNNSGRFSITLSDESETIVSIQAFGYNDTTFVLSKTITNIEVDSLFLTPSDSSIVLNEVVVSAKPYSIKRVTDRLVMNINGLSELSKNNSILGMLGYAPLIQVDEFQGISMTGREKLVLYINGREAKMTAEQYSAYLSSLPAESIRNIELITNPGSQFNVPANTGIINITLRNSDTDGLRGFATAQIWQTHFNKQIGSLNINYTKDKFGLIATLGVRNIGDWIEKTTYVEFTYSGNSVLRKSVFDNRRQIYSANFDMNYDIDSRQNLGVVANFNLWNGKPKQSAESQCYSGVQQDSIVNSSVISHGYNGWYSVNLNYSINLDERNSIAVEADYQLYKASSKLEYRESTVRQAGASYNQKTPTTNHLWTSKAVYTFKPSPSQKLLIGIQAYSSKSADETNYNNITTNTASGIFDPSRFDYKEKGSSGYANYEYKFSDIISSSFGIRFEHTTLNGFLKDFTDESFYRTINRWLPSLSLTFAPSNSCYLWYNLAMQSSLVPYSYLNPFKVRQTATSYISGNPNLTPPKGFHQGIGLYITGKYLINISHSLTSAAYDIFTLSDGKNEETTMPLNYGNNNGFSASINTNQSFFDGIWIINATLFLDYVHYASCLKEIAVDKRTFYSDFNLDNTVILSRHHSYKLLSSFQIRSARKEIITESKADMRASVEIRKDFGNWSVGVSAFRSWNSDGHGFHASRISVTETTELLSWSRAKGDFQGIMLKATYNWGNRKVSSKKHNTSGSEQSMRYMST